MPGLRTAEYTRAITVGAVTVRDFKDPAGGVLAVPPHAWIAFTTAFRAGKLGS